MKTDEPLLDDPTSRLMMKRDRNAALPLLLAALPVVYVLMVGPAVFFYHPSSRPTQRVIETVYAPLEWLDRKIPGEPIQKYAELWD